ncbi:heterocyst development glycosyltransferase HepC [Dolichospermum planctonicum]|uniref:Sugar transferase n=1 Tax=Dolichospermum planctonicum TaxID=136072 RepID=A0A480AB28_9CYAN|nr:sugar transferase [Dolichospermum planctonicum]
MPTSVISNLNNNSIIPQQSENISSLSCTLKWRRGKLLVKSSGKLPHPYLASLENQQSLIECLKHSPITLVSIDPKIGDSLLRLWADACQKANKPIFMSIPSYQKLPKKSNEFFRFFSRIIDWNFALFLLLFMMPFLIGGLIIMQIYSARILLNYEWYVGANGQLFQAIKFHSKFKDDTRNFPSGLCKYFLDIFSNLLNVLQGKYCLINNHCLSLEDAVKLSLEEQKKVKSTNRIYQYMADKG